MDSASEIASVSFVGAACTLRRFGASRFCSVRDARGALAGESGIGRGECMAKAKQGVCPSDEVRALSIAPMGGSMVPRIPTALLRDELVIF